MWIGAQAKKATAFPLNEGLNEAKFSTIRFLYRCSQISDCDRVSNGKKRLDLIKLLVPGCRLRRDYLIAEKPSQVDVLTRKSHEIRADDLSAARKLICRIKKTSN